MYAFYQYVGHICGHVYQVIFGNVTIGGLKVPISRFYIQIILLHLFLNQSLRHSVTKRLTPDMVGSQLTCNPV